MTMPGEATQRVVPCSRTEDHDMHPNAGDTSEEFGWCPGKPASAILEVPKHNLSAADCRMPGDRAVTEQEHCVPCEASWVPRAGDLRVLTEEVQAAQEHVIGSDGLTAEQREATVPRDTSPPLAMEYEFKHGGLPIRISRLEVQTIPTMGQPGRGQHRPGWAITVARSQAVEVHLLAWDHGRGTITGVVGTGGTIGYDDASPDKLPAEDALKVAETYAREVAEAILDYQAAIDAAAIAFQHRVVAARAGRCVVPVVEDRKPE
jgi:hypothetical protein